MRPWDEVVHVNSARPKSPALTRSPQRVEFVEKIDDIEADFEGTDFWNREGALQREVDRFVGWQFARVDESVAQAVSVKKVGGNFPIVPSVGSTGRPGEALVVIEENPVILQRREFVRRKENLRGTPVRSAVPFVTQISVGGKRPVIIARGKFATVDFAALVVERGE